ncbi:hypothetical protein PIB30_053773 [Stylosanthes scabra]|uniref:Uncharacterized protein n=1 Tax=Stylosanthes scabra TaxID=79078 RepID=A0ABU6UIG6_9FABA|nr:hypothetical protein [Stylosanthes scabra]
MKDRKRSGPARVLRKYNRWLSSASTGSVRLGYNNRPDGGEDRAANDDQAVA